VVEHGFDLSYEQMKCRLGGLVGKHCTVLVYPSHDRELVVCAFTGTLRWAGAENFRARLERDLGDRVGIEAAILGFEEHRDAEIVLWVGLATGYLVDYQVPRLVIRQGGVEFAFEEHT